jgi:NitT/TauT family transport system substrate-binding protein
MARRTMAAALTILAGLLPAGARAETTLEVAYIPIMPMAQLFVMEGEGWTKAEGLNLKLTKFSSGPAIVQAIASGGYDVMYLGIGPAMVSRANGVPIKVVASNIVEQVGLVARGDFAKVMTAAASPADGVRRFTAETGRKPKIATLPKGSTPDTVLRYWLLRVAGLELDDVEILGMGEDKVQQAMLARTVDAASILEPVVTIIRDRLPDTAIVAAGSEMFKDQPGAIVAVRESVLADKRDAIAALVALHLRATELLKSDPKRAARDVHAFVGKGLVPIETIEQAIRSPLSNFVSDPHRIVPATQLLQDFSAEVGTLKKAVNLSELFDTSIYDKIVKRR